jgi:hypothetical protein
MMEFGRNTEEVLESAEHFMKRRGQGIPFLLTSYELTRAALSHCMVSRCTLSHCMECIMYIKPP